METCDRLKALRMNLGLTQKELGEQLGISTVSIHHWEAGTKNPSVPAIIALAQIFGVTTDYLLGVESTQEKLSYPMNTDEVSLLSAYRVLDSYGRNAVDTICRIEKARVESVRITPVCKSNIISLDKKPARYIPRYTTPSAAGYSVPLDGDDFEMILVDDDVPNDADFAVCIQGESMYPYIKDGDTVYVKKDCELYTGDVGIFCVDGAMYCKQYYIDDNRNITLVSANQKLRSTNVYISADSGASVKCYGKVLLDTQIEMPSYMFE